MLIRSSATCIWLRRMLITSVCTLKVLAWFPNTSSSSGAREEEKKPGSGESAGICLSLEEEVVLSGVVSHLLSQCLWCVVLLFVRLHSSNVLNNSKDTLEPNVPVSRCDTHSHVAGRRAATAAGVTGKLPEPFSPGCQ